MKSSIICTLFEGHYHHGVAALYNSLYSNGYRGTIYVGYRGELPSWALKGKRESIEKWGYAITLTPIKGMQIVFLPLVTNYSLTNYKPDFMMDLWEGPAKDADAMFYFDSDIIINKSWACFEQWVNCGVALCEDINSPMQEFHPCRVGWRNYYKNFNIDLLFKNQIYVNGGFIGLVKKDISFLSLWIQLQECMAKSIGGLENSIFLNQNYNSTIIKTEGFQIFAKSDQDALNATIEACKDKISYLSKKEGMGFGSLDAVMFHALGSPKPWKANYLLRIINGRSPRPVDEYYWNNKNFPITTHHKFEKKRKIISIKISKFIGKFYKI